MKTREAVYLKVVEILSDLFEVDVTDISESSRLYDDLDIDSIDAIDLVVELKSYAGKKIGPDDFKSVRSVGDVVNAVCELLGNE
ncbi:MAG: acyl carrier protein [Porticoccus sp.]|nr:acyl carrier protein [Porticoccus sp.]MBQ0807574.1 acyl carrier protein [Porticoccus sp.]